MILERLLKSGNSKSMLYYIHCADVPLSIPLFFVKYNLLWRIFYDGMCSGDVFCSNTGITTQGRLVTSESGWTKMKCKKWLKARQCVPENEDHTLLDLHFDRFKTLLIFREFSRRSP